MQDLLSTLSRSNRLPFGLIPLLNSESGHFWSYSLELIVGCIEILYQRIESLVDFGHLDLPGLFLPA
jgi:hypothetical protein